MPGLQPPQIVLQPASQAGVWGGRVVFTVVATGTPPLAYQWSEDGLALAGATHDVLILTNLQFSSAGEYAVTVSNAAGTLTSSQAELTVSPPQAGDVDGSFDPGAAINGTIEAVAVQGEGKILIAGGFTSVEGAALGRLARLKPDGSTDHTFLHGLSGANDWVECLAVQPDGKVLIGGDFTTVNEVSRNCIARLNADGSLDETFLPSCTGANGRVWALALQPDGQVLAGGEFGGVNGQPRTAVARLWGSPGAAGILIQPADQRIPVGGTATFTVTASGLPPLSYQWRRDGVDLADDGPISGATTPTLTLTDVSVADAGHYTVVISNAHGALTSAPARVSVWLELRIEPVDGRAWPLLRFPAIDQAVCELAVEWTASLHPAHWQVLYVTNPFAASVVLPVDSADRARFYRLVLRPCRR